MPKNNQHKTSFYVSAPQLWNKIPNEIRTIGYNDEFQNEYKKHLMKLESIQ